MIGALTVAALAMTGCSTAESVETTDTIEESTEEDVIEESEENLSEYTYTDLQKQCMQSQL